MAKQVQVLVSCDWCKKRWQQDDPEAPREKVWQWDGVERMLDLCDHCQERVDELVKQLKEVSVLVKSKKRGAKPLSPQMIEMRARRPKLKPGTFDKYKDSEGMYVCPKEDCYREPFKYPQHLGNHYSRKHGEYLS